MENLNQTIGEYVAQDYRAATVFGHFKIDFCCKGNRTIDEACEGKNIDPSEVREALYSVLNEKADGEIDFNSWPMDLLADYIEKKHHRYVEGKIPILLQYLDKLCKVHGDAHPELMEINRIFTESAADLTSHMNKEELILFPYVRKMIEYRLEGKIMDVPHFSTITNPIEMMMEEHEAEGERFEKIAQLTDGFNPPADACNTYKVTYALLEEFVKDLHKHIHLENNILFPNAIKAEKSGEVIGV